MKTTLLPTPALQLLVNHTMRLPECGHVVCAGVYGGGDICAMAQYRPDLIFTAIDSFDGLEKPTKLDGGYSAQGMFAYDFDQYLENTKNVRLFTHKMVINKKSVKKLELGRIDMLWLDLDHAEPTRCMLERCLPFCTEKAIILTHDYTNANYPGVRKVCDTFGRWDHRGYSIAKMVEVY